MISLIFFIIYTLFSVTVATDTLKPNQPLSGNQTLISSSSRFALGFFPPPNSSNLYLGIWYYNIPLKTVAWVANRDTPVTDLNGTLTLTPTGTLTITNSAGSLLWSSSSSTSSTILHNPVAQLMDNGNLIITDSSGSIAWQSFDHPTDTLMGGMKLGVDFRRNLTTSLTSWKSASDPSTGDYTIAFNFTGDPEVYLSAGSTKIWRSGPWDGLQFSGIPETIIYPNFNSTYISDDQEISYSIELTEPSIVSRLVVNYTGVVQRSAWVEGGGDWNYFWYAPRDQCDDFGACGAYGVCDPNNSPSCNCMQGFTPRHPANWALDGSGGCVRKTELDCRNGTDGFVMMSGAKLPDTRNCTVDRGMSLDECRDRCLKNCSCTGYAADVSSGGGGGGVGSGCVIWMGQMVDTRVYTDAGQDLYVRLAAPDLASATVVKKKARIVVSATLSILLGGLLLTSVACFLWRKRRVRQNGTVDGHWRDDSNKGEEELELPLLDLATVMAATDNFKLENKLGEGGFGPVYKGKLIDGQDIAVKRLSKTSIQGVVEFKNEVTLIAKLQHRNLVRLLGCCVHGEERMLIYEYMQNKSLDAFLFDKVNGVHLDWSIRYHIIMGVARGLLYLHQDSIFRIIHRDLKASNILLDKEMNPKISDFGLARIFEGDAAITKTTRVVGTYGYMSPEYAMDGIFSVKSDVFSFGVLVLEIISGRKNKAVYNSEPHLYLLGTAWILWNDGKWSELMDPDIKYRFSIPEVMRCIKVGLLCVQERAEYRPTMSSTLLMLSSDSATLPDPKQPAGFVFKKDPPEPNSPLKEKDWNSVNELTNTMSVGR